MATRTHSRRADWSRSFVAFVGFGGVAAILAYLVLSGMTYDLTSGSELGLYATVAVFLVAGLCAVASLVALVTTVRLRARTASMRFVAPAEEEPASEQPARAA
ncbi:MAG: hypothetical protein IT304_02025 [Dehalococcoidia bacterium]|nr:hypothetical protein [Dehalococcoidia bacterium]